MKKETDPKLSIRLAKFFLPIVVGFGVYGIWGFFSDELLRVWPFLVAYFFPPFGKETVIPLSIGLLEGGLTVPFINLHLESTSVNPLSIALAVAFIDIVIAWFLVWNYDLAKKIPFVGQFMTRVENIGKKSSSKYSWIKPLRFIGIALFVVVPFQGSGGLVASILGRLIGMKPWNTFFAITLGAISGCLSLAYFADFVLSVFVKNFLFALLILFVVVIVVFMLVIYLRKNSSNLTKK